MAYVPPEITDSYTWTKQPTTKTKTSAKRHRILFPSDPVLYKVTPRSMNYSLSLHWRGPAPMSQPRSRKSGLVCTSVIPSLDKCMNIYQTSSNTIIHPLFLLFAQSCMQAGIHSFNQAFIYGLTH